MISAVILTKNEESNIVNCIKSLKWCNEIIIIDDGSTDKTREIAKKMGAVVYERGINGNFAQQRNFGLEKAKGEWVLFIDADERVSDSLTTEILYVTSQLLHDINAYYIRRVDYLFGKKLLHGETGNIKLLRLAKKNAGRWEGNVHEEWKIKGEIGELKHPLLHYPHQTISEFLSEINFYTDLRAKDLYCKKIRSFWVVILAYPLGKFLLNYIIKRGFLDGIPGIIFALMMSLHSFLVRGKLWFLWNKTSQ